MITPTKKAATKRPTPVFAMRVSGPGKGQRPAALSFGAGEALRANRDGSFTLTTANLVDLLRRGYKVDPARSRRAISTRTVARKPSTPTVPASAYYRNPSRYR
jgi:hypothetical protein